MNVWEMVKEAAENINRVCKHSEIKEFIKNKYMDVNETTINCQIISCTVNHPSRIHYPMNKKKRIADGTHDFLYSVDRGTVTLYGVVVAKSI